LVALLRQTPELAPAIKLSRGFISSCRAPRLRTMREFAEQEIVLSSDSPVPGRFRCSTQPFAGLFFDQIDSGLWAVFVVTGPSQSGKTLIGYVIPGMYHLFEVGQSVICGVPDMSMASDKWNDDFLPFIESSRYRDLLPTSGQGSRGGKVVESVRFRNGATLRFMSGGGDDKKRAGKTAPVLLVTEANGLARLSARSNEADKIKQLRARLRSYGPRAREYYECTEETDADFIHQALLNGSNSRILMPCPHCGQWVIPERDDLVGWQDAEDEIEAAENTSLRCPNCHEVWSEEQRISANQKSQFVHKTQEITPEGEVTGPMPRTRTFSFRWSAANNLLNPIAMVGAEEWQAKRAIDEENANKELCQFVWGVPIERSDRDDSGLTVTSISERQGTTELGVVPEWSDAITLGVDAGKNLMHWVLLATDLAKKRHVQIVDYGIEEVHSRQFPEQVALSMAIDSLTGRAEKEGWPDENGEHRTPDAVWWDAGYEPIPFYRHCTKNPRHWPTKGQGLGQYGGARYHVPKTTGSIVLQIYDGFHLSRVKHESVGAIQLYECDADQGKSRIHDRLSIPMDEPGAIILPRADRSVEHLSFAKHLLAEHLVEIDGVLRWMPTPGHGRHNHWLDAISLALMALQRMYQQPKPKARQRRPALTMPDGRPYLATAR